MRVILLLLSGFLFSINVNAQSYVGPQASAMGGAGRAAIVPGESAFLNPATVPFFGEYFATGFYSQGSHPNSGDKQELGLLLSDGVQDRLFQGALAYVHGNIDPLGAGDATSEDIYGVASGFVARNVTFGLSAHRYLYKANGSAQTIQWNGGAGLIYAHSKTLQFGAVAYDLLKPKDSVPLEARLNRTYGIGANYKYDTRFNFRFDLLRPTEQNPDNNTDVLTGFESRIFEYLAFRAGFGWQESRGPERRVFTTGLGFTGPKLRADYSFEKDTKVAGGTRHSFDLWMQF